MEEGGTSQVRRTSRARKVNPKFFGDDAEYGSYKKLVDRITASDFSGSSKDNESSKQLEENGDALEAQERTDSDTLVGGNIDSVNLKSAEPMSMSNQPLSKHGDASGSINIALKTVSVKMPKKCKSNISIQDNLKLSSGKVAPSVIVRCRSSTESEDSVENECEKRKLHSQGGNEAKKLKLSENQDNNCNDKDKTQNTNLKLSPFANCSQLFRKSYVPLPIVSNLDKNQAKIVVTSDGKLNLPGKRLKIVSLKPITTINKDNIHLDTKSKSNSESIGNKLMLGEGGPLELKIVKKQIYPLSGSSLPPIVSKENKNEANKSLNKTVKTTESISSTKLFSSDGEDDIPLNKFIKQDTGKKKKKSTQKENNSQKSAFKTKVKNKKINKKSRDANDQDDLPLKTFIKKSKALSKGLSTKVKNTVSKKKDVQTSNQSIQENLSQINEPPSKKKKMDSDPSQKLKVPLKLKFRNLKSGTGVKSQKMKPLVIKKKKINSINSGKSEKFKNVLGINDKKIKKAKARKLLSSEHSSVSIKKKENKPLQKLRFKFPKKISKAASNDSPISNETTNIVISVSGIEGDYACVAIDKDHISVPSDANEDNDTKQNLKKKKNKKLKNSFASSEKYTVDSGLVLEADVSNSTGISEASETKTKFVSKVESSSSDVPSFSSEKDSLKIQKTSKNDSSKKESSAKKERKKIISDNKESHSVKRKFACFKDDSDILLQDPVNVQSSYKKEDSQLNVDSADVDVEPSYEVETLTDKGNSTSITVDNFCDDGELCVDKKGKPFTGEIKPATEETKTPVAKMKSSTDTLGILTGKVNVLSSKDKSLNDEVKYDDALGEVNSAICKMESFYNDTKSILNSRDPPSNKAQTTLDKTKISNWQEIVKKPMVNKFDEVEDQYQHLRIEENVVTPVKSEKNVNETNENIGGNKHGYNTGEQKSSREMKYSKPRSKEINEKENSKENKKDCILKSEGKKDKEKNKRKEEKDVDLKSDTSRKFDISLNTDKKIINDSDHQRYKIQKSENKDEKEKSYLNFRSPNEIHYEERHIKKEKHDSKEQINKTLKDSKSKERIEKSQRESQVLKKSEKYQSFSKENENSKSSSITILKTNKDTNKIPDKKETKIEKDYQMKDAVSPVIKSKKKENFEEALLNIPLPKLSKSRKDKEDKLKKTPSKDKKFEVKEIKQELYLLKHKEPDSSKSLKTDKPLVKSESNSKVFKTEEKSYRKEERRHSSSSSSDKRKYDYDSKDGIKLYETSHDSDKSKKEERERSRHSHKKHKRDHSDSPRSYSLSSERKKHRSDEKYERKHNKDKIMVKKEDNKDVIIKKIVDGKESDDFNAIKTELNASVDHNKQEKIVDESSIVNLPDALHTKMELKSEVIIDEEHLVNKKGHLKEEIKDDEVCDLDENKISNVSGTYLKKEPFSSEQKEKETDFPTMEKKQQEKRPTTYGDILSIESNDVNIKQNYVDNEVEKIYQTETLVNSDKGISDVTESDIGILDELRSLKQTFENPQNNKEMETSENSATISEAETKLISSESHNSKIKLGSPTCLSSDCEEKANESTILEPSTKEDIKPEILDTVSLDDSDVMNTSVTLHPKLEADGQKSNLLQDSIDNLECFPQSSSRSNNSDLQLKEQENTNKNLIISDISNSRDDKLEISNIKLHTPEDSPYLCSIPISSIPLPNEISKEPMTEKVKFEASPQDENSHLSKEVPPFVSDADEGFISEVSSGTKENFSSDEGTPLASDLSDDESLSAVTLLPASLQPPKELTPEEKEEMERRNIEIVEKRMKSFEYLEENLYLSERVKNKRSKEVRRMVCDCTLTKEEIINDEMGCGDDCLNRLLMIEWLVFLLFIFFF